MRRLPVLAAGTAALTVAVLRRMRREFNASGELSPPMVAAMYACYAAHATATAQAARHRSGAVPLSSRPAAGTGAVLVVGGMTLCAAGMDRFASVGQISGTDIGDLTTAGVYRYSRNPQYTGYIALLSGVGLARRSGGVLALAGAAALVFRWWVPVEEGHLEREFGDAYRRYRNQTPRWLGLRHT
jgi:protein-S-isoprenylcysteine O-methyltransferase Ste14